jgi:hypothetical protein
LIEIQGELQKLANEYEEGEPIFVHPRRLMMKGTANNEEFELYFGLGGDYWVHYKGRCVKFSMSQLVLRAIELIDGITCTEQDLAK